MMLTSTLTLTVAFFLPLCTSSGDSINQEQLLKERWDQFMSERSKPLAFDLERSSPTEIHVVTGKDVFISCGFNRKLSGKLKVSFLRVETLQLISVGNRLHSAKARRYEVLHTNDSDRMWTLRIRQAQESDSGQYECQVNTQPRSLQRLFNVSVVTGKVRVDPEGDVTYVNVGSTLNLTCYVKALPLRPKRITWYKDDQIVEFSHQIKASLTSNLTHGFYSVLTIPRITPNHSGWYRCDSDVTPHDSRVRVYVLETVEAWQKQHSLVAGGNSYNSSSSSQVFLLSLFIQILFNLSLFYP